MVKIKQSKERKELRMKEKRENKRTAATEDFESEYTNNAFESFGPALSTKDFVNGHDDDDKKKGTKRKRQSADDMEAEVDWSTLDLKTELTIDSSAMAMELGDIPFTLEVPLDINGFEALMSGKTPEQQIVLLKRMRSANHVRLHEDNKSHITRLYDMLMDYFRTLCVEYEPTTTPNSTQVGALKKDIEFYQHIDVVTRGLFALSHDIPKYAKATHMKRLDTISTHLHYSFNRKMNNHLKLIDENDKHCNMDPIASFMPSGYALFYLKLLAHIFPTKNKAHTLMTSLILILAKILSELTINGPRDVACALFCITLLMDIVRKEQRYAPEVIHSLRNILRAGFLSPDSFDKTTFDLLKETDDLYFTFRAGSTIWYNLKNQGDDDGHSDGDDSTDSHSQTQQSQMALPLRYIFLKDNGHEVFQRKEF